MQTAYCRLQMVKLFSPVLHNARTVSVGNYAVTLMDPWTRELVYFTLVRLNSRRV